MEVWRLDPNHHRGIGDEDSPRSRVQVAGHPDFVIAPPGG